VSEPRSAVAADAASVGPEAARGSRGGRAFLVTVDQALSSITNLLAVVWVAHAVSVVEFGSFSLLLLVYTFVMGPIHALISMRVVVHPEDADHRPRWVLGSALVLGTVGGLGCALVGVLQVLAGASIGPSMVALGAALPLLVVQDVGRWVAIARSRPSGAIVLDAAWLLLLVGAFVALAVTDQARLFTLTAAWAGSGAVAALLLPVAYGFLRPAEFSLRWLRERWDQSWRLLVGNVTAAGSVLAGAALVALVSTPVAVAAVRAAILLGRPTTAIQNAVASSMAADVARERPDNRGLLRFQRRTMTVSAVVALANLALLMLLPDAAGQALLGNVWPVIEPLMLPVTLWLVVAAAQSGVPPALIGRHQFQVAMVVQIVGGLLSMAALVAGALVDSVTGAVWGLVIGQGATAAAWWVGLLWHFSAGQGLHRAGPAVDG
jgi:hypothetical protein